MGLHTLGGWVWMAPEAEQGCHREGPAPSRWGAALPCGSQTPSLALSCSEGAVASLTGGQEQCMSSVIISHSTF